jgi:hypothetical protein
MEIGMSSGNCKYAFSLTCGCRIHFEKMKRKGHIELKTKIRIKRSEADPWN